MLLSALCLSACLTGPNPMNGDLLTVAESSEFTETARYDQVIDLLDRIEVQSRVLQRAVMGTTNEGREIPLVILADPPITSAAEARASGKLIAFAFGNIHAGEVCGKEALLMLARELALNPDHPWFENMIVVLAPIYNTDGNERFDPGNRPGQNGPDEMGQRPNAQGFDLNRDYIKLESPEGRSMARFHTEWDPHVTIDTHTTNGSQHRLTLTYDVPLNPAGHPEPIAFARHELLPAVTDRVREKTGYEMFFYGNFNRDQTVWTTYSHQPRFGGSYQGLRGQMSILSEAYSYAPYKDRVLCTHAFVSEIFQYCHERASDIQAMHERVKAETIAAGENPQPDDLVHLRASSAAFKQPVTLKGWEMEASQGRRRPRATDRPMDYSVIHVGHFIPTRSVPRPYAYLIKPGLDNVVEKLRQHGIQIEPFAGRARVEAYTIDEISRARRPFQGHENVLVEATASIAPEAGFQNGSWLVRMAQPLGTLAAYLLEPESDDGLVQWNYLDNHIEVGGTYPIYRVMHPMDIHPFN